MPKETVTVLNNNYEAEQKEVTVIPIMSFDVKYDALTAGTQVTVVNGQESVDVKMGPLMRYVAQKQVMGASSKHIDANDLERIFNKYFAKYFQDDTEKAASGDDTNPTTSGEKSDESSGSRNQDSGTQE